MQYSKRIDRLAGSPIRDILQVVEKPGMISFAGGLPADDSFPDLGDLPHRAFMQYGATEGEPALRARIAEDLCKRGLRINTEQVLVLSGSQQGIDLVAKLMIDQGTSVAVESPTYLAALQVFSLFGARYSSFTAGQSDHLRLDKPNLIYVIPTFQNPTGYCYSTAERVAMAETADQMESVLFEDDPYRDLVYDECDRTPVCAFLNRSSWVYQSSFSKTLAPGLRLGYLACSEDLLPSLARLKQAADLHSSRLSQALVLSALGKQSSRLPEIVDGYRCKRDQFAHQLDQTMGSYATWSVPCGGLFFWLTLNSNYALDCDLLLKESLQNNVAFMPGKHFYYAEPTDNCIRLNFSHADEAQMKTGLSVLADLISCQLVNA